MNDNSQSKGLMLFDEELLSLMDAAKLLPATKGKPVHHSTVWRWATRGIGAIRLETRRVGVRFFTSREALERFTVALSEVPPPSRQRHVSRGRSPKRRAREIAAAQEELRKAGL